VFIGGPIPSVPGTILQVNISRGGLPKMPILSAFLSPLGVDGDDHAHPQFHGGPTRAILIVSSEVVDSLIAKGFPLFYGALGENLTTRGLRIHDLRPGDRLRAGGAVVEITTPRVPCYQLDVYGPTIKQEIYDRKVKALDHSSPRWGMSGLYASVVQPGPVGPGDPIELLSALA
jgi:MOSC domain-containing protein YiiM